MILLQINDNQRVALSLKSDANTSSANQTAMVARSAAVGETKLSWCYPAAPLDKVKRSILSCIWLAICAAFGGPPPASINGRHIVQLHDRLRLTAEVNVST
jgi:hypothetical protein